MLPHTHREKERCEHPQKETVGEKREIKSSRTYSIYEPLYVGEPHRTTDEENHRRSRRRKAELQKSTMKPAHANTQEEEEEEEEEEESRGLRVSGRVQQLII